MPHLRKAIRVWLDGLKATKIAWNGDHKEWEDTGFPDHKIRGEHALRIIEFAIGKAIERSLEVTGSYKDLSTLLSELEQSPEARRLLSPELFAALAGGNFGQSKTEGKESAPPHESEPKSDSEQERS
jgi:hypothetical protein